MRLMELDDINEKYFMWILNIIYEWELKNSKTIKAFVSYLNEIGTCLPYEAFTIGGKERKVIE